MVRVYNFHIIPVSALTICLEEVLVRALKFLREYPRVVLHKRGAEYGEDLSRGCVDLKNISTLQIRKSLLGYPSDNRGYFVVLLYQAREKNG